jgi:hypothetical protein
MKRTLMHSLCTAAMLATIATPVLAHEGHDHAKKPASAAAAAAPGDKAKAPAMDAKHDAMMAEMMKMGQPGKEHEGLKSMAGKWKAVTRSWQGPGEPTVTEGTSEMRMILGDRFLEQHFAGDFMGMKFEGFGLTGYDNLQKRYVFTWVDNMGTGLMSGLGEMDAAGKKITMNTKLPSPEGGMMDAKMITEIIDANQHVFSLYTMMGGQEMKMMEITYTRM